jgi:hypothetical protein
MTDTQERERRVVTAYDAREAEGFSEDAFVDALRLATQMAADGTKPGAALIILRAVQAAVKAEREECAKVCEMVPSQFGEVSRCAAAIRARSEP